MSYTQFFEKLVWQEDRMLLHDIVFRLQHYKDDNTWDCGEECFIFFKILSLVELYRKFWVLHPQFMAKNIFELGMWDGGSIAFWFECFHPEKHVGIDLMKKEDAPYFRKYIQSHHYEKRIATYWGVDQSDTDRLQEIVQQEYSGPLDLVIDDASHLYQQTRRSFEILFPLLRPSGLYIIEDWAWEHWKDFQAPDHPWATEKSPTSLIFELIEVAGTNHCVVANVNIFEGFTVVERGDIDDTELREFNIDHYISRRPVLQRPTQIIKKTIKEYASVKHNLQKMKHYLKQLMNTK